jgi:nucleoside-diphosphate-sugar epimerase
VLLRPESDRSFIAPRLSNVAVRAGSILDGASLRPALAGVSHVIHCAGATKARRVSGFYEVNHTGVRNLVEAVNAAASVRRLIHISSLAAAGPSRPSAPRREEDPPQPVSEYGKSKLAGELEVRDRCRVEYVILRPPAVYGPRDREFLRLFQSVQKHLRPQPSPSQELSLVFVKDLAACAVNCLEPQSVARKAYFVAARQTLTAAAMAREIASQMGTWTVPLPVPALVWWVLCLAQQLQTRLTGKANVLSLQKLPELRAPAWTCDPSRLEADTGGACPTLFKEGVAQTLSWYREQRWL